MRVIRGKGEEAGHVHNSPPVTTISPLGLPVCHGCGLGVSITPVSFQERVTGVPSKRLHGMEEKLRDVADTDGTCDKGLNILSTGS